KTGPAIADALTGLTAAVGLLGALYRRTQTGEGGYVDVAMVDSVFAVLENALATHSATGAAPPRQGNSDTAIAPFDAFECADGWIVLAVGNDRLWRKLVSVVGPYLERPEFMTNDLRLKHYDDLKALLSAWVWPQMSRTVLRKLHRAGIPAGAVRTVDELADDAQLEARDMLMKIPLDDENEIMVPGSPIHISGADRPPRVRAPKLGEHTEEILAVLG
ncbi:MAG: CoA transferase, partial [Chloroflexota bacterium]